MDGAIAWLFAGGHAADVVLAVLAIEAVWLVRAHRWPARAVLLRLGPAALMIVALRLALIDAPWPGIALALALSFPIHLADLRRRGGSNRFT